MSLSCHISYYFLVGIEFDMKLEHFLTLKYGFQMLNQMLLYHNIVITST